MTDFTIVKKYLKEIVASKPEVLGYDVNTQILSKKPFLLDQKLTSNIFKRLIDYPKGKSISKEEMPRVKMI